MEVERLVKNGANRRDEYGLTALHHASIIGNATLVKALLKYKFTNCDLHDDRGYTPLHYATEGEHEEVILALLADKDVLEEDVIKLASLLEPKSDRARERAVRYDLSPIESARKILKQGADVQLRNNDGKTALMLAIERGNLNIFNILLDAKTNANLKNKAGKTAIMMAMERELMPFVDALIPRCNISIKSGEGKTVLVMAVEKGESNLVKKMTARLPRLAHPKDSRGMTALMIALELGHLDIADHLADIESFYRLSDKDGKNALDYALKFGHEALAKKLTEKGLTPYVEKPPPVVSEELMKAVEIDDKARVEELIGKGVELDGKNADGKTALVMSIELGRNEIMDMLIKAGADVNL